MNAFKGAVKTQVANTYSASYNEQIGSKKVTVKGKTKEIPIYRKVNVIIKTELRVICDKAELKPNEHLLHVADDAEATKAAGGVKIYGMADDIGGKDIIFSESKVANMINGKDNNTIVHELGHTFGLRHIDAPNETTEDAIDISNGGIGNPQAISPKEQSKQPNNAMLSGGSPYMNDATSTKLNIKQIKTGLKLLKDGKLNKN
jgi:hypothetical protein